MKMSVLDDKIIMEEKIGNNWNSRSSYWMNGRRINLDTYNTMMSMLIDGNKWQLTCSKHTTEKEKNVYRVEYIKK